MPTRAGHICRPGCPEIVPAGQRHCTRHTVKRTQFDDARRGTRQERGYGTEHDRLREAWFSTPIPALGNVKPVLCGDRITGRSSEHSKCRRESRAITGRVMDHIKPKELGGTNDRSNLQTLCDRCHNVKRQAEAMAARARSAT